MKKSNLRAQDQQVYTPYPLLNLFKVRNPHLSQQISIESWRSFIKQLYCPICKEVFNQPIYIKECFHRFCKKCIETEIRQSNKKSCPSCRNPISSKRLIRQDFQMQGIIKAFLGSIEAYRKQLKQIEQKQALQALQLRRSTSQQQLINSLRKKRKIEQVAIKKQNDDTAQTLQIKELSLKMVSDIKKQICDPPISNINRNTTKWPTLKKDQQHYICLYLENHPSDKYRPKLQNPQLIVKLNTQVKRIKKTIAKKLRTQVFNFQFIDVYIQKQGQYLQLQNSQNLKDLIRTNWYGVTQKIYAFIPKDINADNLKKKLGFKRKLYFSFDIQKYKKSVEVSQ